MNTKLDKTFMLIVDISTRKVTVPEKISWCITDENISHLMCQLIDEKNGDSLEMDKYKIYLRVVKPDKTTLTLEFAIADTNENTFKLTLPTEALNQIGKHACELSIKYQNDVLTSDSFQYVINASVLNDIDSTIEKDSHYPLVLQLEASLITWNEVMEEQTNAFIAFNEEANEAEEVRKANEVSRVEAESIRAEFYDSFSSQLAHIENDLNTRFLNVESIEKIEGEVDDTGRIKRALAISRHIYLPKTYTISEPIELKGGEFIYGNGVMSKITCVGCHSAFINAYKERNEIITQITIKDLQIVSDNSDYGLDLTQVAYSLFENLTIAGFNKDGVYNSIITMNASYNTFLNCIFKRNKRHGITVHHNANSTRLISCIFTSNEGFGVMIDGLGQASVQSCEIFAGSVEGNTLGGIYLDGRGCTINAVHIEGNAPTLQDGYGVDVNTQSLYDNSLFSCYFYHNGSTYDNHVRNVMGYPRLVLGLASNLQMYANNSGLFIPEGTMFNCSYAGNVGMFSEDGNITLQTVGANVPVMIKGKGGNDIPLQFNDGMQINGFGSFTNSRANYYSFDNPIRLGVIDSTIDSPPSRSIFIDSSDNKLKFKTTDGVIKTII